MILKVKKLHPDAVLPTRWSSRTPKIVGSLESSSACWRVRGFAGTRADLKPEINL